MTSGSSTAPKRALCSARSRVSGLGATSLMVTTGSPAACAQALGERRERRVRIGDERIGLAGDQLRQFGESIGAERDRDRVAVPPHSPSPDTEYRQPSHCQIQKFHANYWKWQ